MMIWQVSIQPVTEPAKAFQHTIGTHPTYPLATRPSLWILSRRRLLRQSETFQRRRFH